MSEHLAQIRAEEALLDELAATRATLHGAGRHTLGLDRDPTSTASTMPRYPLVALCSLGFATSLWPLAFVLLGHQVAVTLGTPLGTMTVLRNVILLLLTVAPVLAAVVVGRQGWRAPIAFGATFASGITVAASALVTSAVVWALLFTATAVLTGAAVAAQLPLLLDHCPPGTRARGVMYYAGAVALAQGIGASLIVLSDPVHLTWRGEFLLLGTIGAATALVAARVRDPGMGVADELPLRRLAASEDGASAIAADLKPGEIFRRLARTESVRRMGLGLFASGFFTVPYVIFLSYFLEQRWQLGHSGRAAVLAVLAGVGASGLIVAGRRVDRIFSNDPAEVVRRVAVALFAAAVFTALGAASPSRAVTVALLGLGGTAFAIVVPALLTVLPSVVNASMRPHLCGLIALNVGIGALSGINLLSGVDTHFGPRGALAFLLVPAGAGALMLRHAGRSVNADLDALVDRVLDDAELAEVLRSGGRVPMLACRGVEFAYGQLQVLFGVNFTVDDGEMVALLGVNGAGKSTLLKVISGIGIPTAGTVRYRGRDITYLDAERRVQLGITQVPGGRAVFGPMTVVENLRLFGYTLGRDRAAVDRAIDIAFEAFPRLHERRHSNAAMLSGGEQQMLGLSKALILRPQVLLIDELSLGLAPVIVQQLLELVRRINDTGTAVVLVEQSVNIALSLVDHAYFMEKGQMRFDGASHELLERDELLRAVFLEGAVAGVGR